MAAMNLPRHYRKVVLVVAISLQLFILLVIIGYGEAFVGMDAVPCLQQQQYGTTSTRRSRPRDKVLYGMKRPLLDRIASTLFRLETDRVKRSSVEDEKGRYGEPMEWSDRTSFANRFSQLVADNDIGYTFKQFVADIVAGNEYDEQQVSKMIDDFVTTNKVAIFSFTTCPFCRRAKDLLDSKSIPYQAIELDELPDNEGNEIRAVLGRKTRRTSVPSIWINGEYIGGCNDGNPGLIPLDEMGELDNLVRGIRR